MDTKKVFRKISNKIMEDFEISAEINHQGSKGTYRENSLKKFLSQGRLPTRYAIGSGEIVGPAHNVSKQSDLIIYDQLNGFSLIYDENTQVYPIECVSGVIEVKSTLNKTEFIKSLENIKSVKQLVPNETTSEPLAGGWKMAYKRPSPFGAIFAYRLADNSLDSLVDNLNEWEKNTPKEYWPNIIAILDEGLIYHYKKGARAAFSNSDLEEAIFPTAIHYKKDTLFKFYSAIIDLCASTKLGSIELGRYFDQAEQIGKYVVSNHNRITKNGQNGVYKLSESFITKVVEYCKAQGEITHQDLLIKRFGTVPQGMEKDQLNYGVYLYNPENLKGMHEVENAISFESGSPVAAEGIMEPCHFININNETYYIPWVYIRESDIEVIPGRTVDDL